MAEERTSGPARSRRGLGRGLGALFEAGQEADAPELSGVTEVDIDRLEPNRDQPRQDFDPAGLEELAVSIRDQGIISPLIVTPSGPTGNYKIVAGERRWRAARLAGLDSLPVIVRHLTADAVQRQALIDNVVRQDLNAMEEAEAYDKLIKDYGLTQENLATALGKSRPAVANTLRLLNLPESIRELVRKGQLSPGHARALLALTDATQQSRAAAEILAKEMSVRDTEELVKDIKELRGRPGKKPAAVQDKARLHIRDLEDKLRRALGARVTVEGGQGPGKIVIRYHSADERERLIEHLLRSRP